MPYDLEAHKALLRSLETVDDDRQLFFSLWCLDVLWLQASSYVQESLSVSARAQLQAAHDGLWRCCLTDEAVRVVEMVESALSEVPDPLDFGNPTLEEAATFEFLECLMAAATCDDPLGLAKHCGLESVHYVDASGDGESATLAEVAQQAVMLDYLVSGAPLSEALRNLTRKGLAP